MRRFKRVRSSKCLLPADRLPVLRARPEGVLSISFREGAAQDVVLLLAAGFGMADTLAMLAECCGAHNQAVEEVEP